MRRYSGSRGGRRVGRGVAECRQRPGSDCRCFETRLLNLLQQSSHPNLLLFGRRGHQQHVLGCRWIVGDFTGRHGVTAIAYHVLLVELDPAQSTLHGRRRPHEGPQWFRTAVTRRGHVKRKREELVTFKNESTTSSLLSGVGISPSAGTDGAVVKATARRGVLVGFARLSFAEIQNL